MATYNVKCHFDLDLNLAKCKDKKQLEFRICTLNLYLLEDTSPLQLAIRNILGVFYYYTGQYHKAYESFSYVLKHDKDNLNALENNARVCFRLQNSKEEEEFRARYKTIENNSPGPKIMARFKAEHAYAHAFECYLETNELRRYRISNEIYHDCLEMTSEFPDMSKERAEWKMCMVWNYKKLFNRNFTIERPKENNEELYLEILETLFDILNLVPNDQYHRCFVYGYLGYFSWKKPVSKNQTSQDMPIPEIVKKKGLEEKFKDPEKLFEEALKDQDDVLEVLEVLQLYGSWLQSKRCFDKSLGIFSKCVEIKPTGSNYFSYSKRGEVLLSKAKVILDNNGTLSSVEEYLDKAIRDFEFVATVDPTSFLFGHLESAYCLRSDGGKNRQMKANCLGAFERGLDCLDGRRDPTLHFKHSECLRKFGEKDLALQAIKRSIDTQFPKSKSTDDISLLLEWYIEKIASGSPEFVTEAIPDLIHWFIVAFEKYDRSQFKKMFIELIKGHCHEIKVDIFIHLFLKQKAEINQFIVEVFETEAVLSACEGKNFTFGIGQLFSSMAITPTKSLKHSKNLQPRNRSGFDYDFFVIYSDKDRSWVIYSLLNHLENTSGFKAFLDHRDFTPGKTILDNIEMAISKSYKFILVITPNFVNSTWCQHESQTAFTTALNKKQNGLIIPIVKDGATVPDFLKNINHLDASQLERLAEALD